MKIAFTLSFVTCLLASGVVGIIDPYTLPNSTYKLYQAWDNGREVQHYTFNVTMVGQEPLKVAPIAPIFKLLLDKNDDLHNTTQASIIASIPGDPGYSDLWQVIKVVVPPGLPVIKSHTVLQMYVANKTATLYPTAIYVNCPVVGSASTLENPSDAPRVTGFYQGYNVSWFDFGPNPAGNATAPLYHVMTKNGLVELTDSNLGDANYSAFWNIYTVQPSAANAATMYSSFAQTSGDNITFAGILANCPIVSSMANSSATNNDIPATSGVGITVPSVVLSIVAMAVVSALL